MVSAVTDPALLAELNAGSTPTPAPKAEPTAAPSGQTPVSDPITLAQLNAAPSTSDRMRELKPAESVIPYVADKFKQGAANLLGLAGAPVSLIATGAEILDKGVRKALSNERSPKGMAETMAGKEYLGGMPQVTRGWENLLGVQKVKAPKTDAGGDSKANEYLGTIAEFLGGSFFPGAGATAMASRKLMTATTIALGTAASATTAVEGKEIGGRLAPSFGLTKEEGEQIGFGVGSLAGPKMIGLAAQGIAKGMNAGKSQLAANDIQLSRSPEAQKAMANNLLRQDIANALEHAPESEANVLRAMELKKKVDGFSPNLAQMTGAPGLEAMYKEVANKSPAALAKAADAEARNLASIQNYKEKVFPVTGQDVTNPARVKLSADRVVADFALQRASEDLSKLTDKFRRTADNEAIGNELRSMYWTARQQVKGQVDSQLGDVYKTAQKFNIRDDMTDVRDAVKKIVTADRTTFQDMPPTFSKILSEYPEGTAPVVTRVPVVKAGAKTPTYRTETKPGVAEKSDASFEELHSLYKQANKDWADATAAGNNTKAFYMKAIRDQLQAKVNAYAADGYGELAQKFNDYNRNYAKYATTFREGAGGEIGKRTRQGIATDAEDIVSKVILQAGDKKKGVQDFFEVYGGDPRAAELLHDGILDNFSKAAVKNGTLNPQAARSWMARHNTALGELPELKKALENTTTKSQTLVDRRLVLQKQREVLDRTVLAKIARSDQPEKLVQEALVDPKKMKALLVGAQTEESKQAIARAIADSVLKQPHSFDYLLAHEASLKPVMNKLGAGHWDNLKDIAEMEKISARTKAPTAVELAKLQDIGEKTIGTSVKGMFSRLRNLDKPMGVSKEYMVLDVGGRFFYKIRSEELARLRESAMFDPEAAHLLAKLGKQNSYTRKDLLDLQRISFNAGANSVAQEVGLQRDDASKPR